MDEKSQYYTSYSRALDNDNDEDPYPTSEDGIGFSEAHPTTRFHQIVSRRRVLRRFFAAACLSFLIWIVTSRWVRGSVLNTLDEEKMEYALSEEKIGAVAVGESANVTKVPLEAHVMSKCPDARDCLQLLVVPAMERISDKVDWTLSYIGSVDPDSDAVACKHGPSECLGNMILLCAAQLYPSPVMSLGFANCMISSWKQIPDRELTEQCALEHGMDFDKINGCLSDEGDGLKLLRSSIQHSADLDVKISCTVRLADEVRCVRDGKQWKDCPGGSSVDDLVRDVEKLYEERNS